MMQTETMCGDCAEARRRSLESGVVYECVCGRRVRPPVVRVYRADPDAPPPERSALDRAGHAALTADSPELVRVRRVLADLRPDCPDPMVPPASAPAEVETVRVRETRAPWDVDLPRGLVSGLGAQLAAAQELATRCVADVLAEVSALPPDAAAVLRWMRAHGTLDAGLRGLHVDAALRFADAGQREAWGLNMPDPPGGCINARHKMAPKFGERLVTRACEAWEKRAR